MTNPTLPSASADNEQEDELNMEWRAYTDFWKIVGRHSKHWNYSKMETITKLQEWIDSLVAHHTKEAERRARIDEAQIAAASYENSDSYPGIGKRLYDRLAELAAPAVHKRDMEGGADKPHGKAANE